MQDLGSREDRVLRERRSALIRFQRDERGAKGGGIHRRLPTLHSDVPGQQRR